MAASPSSGPAPLGHHQALRRAGGQRRDLARARRRRGAGAARRERRRQVDAGVDPVRPLRRRRRHDRGLRRSRCRRASPKAALAAGIGMVHQHFTLADNLSVLDNVMLGTEPLWQPFSRRREARAQAAATWRSASACRSIPTRASARLSVGERQRVEILKALYRGARILILDEPTAVLTPQESEALFATLGADGGAGPVDHLHQPQAAARCCACRTASRCCAAASWWPRRRAAGTTRGAARAVDGRPGGRARRCAGRPRSVGDAVCALENVQHAGRRAATGCDAVSLHAARRRDRRHRRRVGQRPGGAGRAAVRHAPRRRRHGAARRARPCRPTPARLVAARRRAHPGRPARGRRRRRPAGVGERGLRAPAQPRLLALVGGAARRRARAMRARVDRRPSTCAAAARIAPARSLSGGNMQKLILGRALLAPEGAGRRRRG